MASQLLILLGDLAESEDRLSVLTDIQIYTNGTSAVSYADVIGAKSEHLVILFSCLNDDQREVAAQACQVLGKLLNGMRPIKVYDTYKQQILLGLEHPNCDVKSLCCQQLYRVCQGDKDILIYSPEFIRLLIDCVCVESDASQCGLLNKTASEALLLIGGGELGEQCLFSVSSTILAYLKECLLRCSSTVWFRLMQIVVDCCASSTGAMRICETNTLLHMLLSKINDTADILSQAVAVEMLTGLGCVRHGYSWLSSQDVFATLLSVLEDGENTFAMLIQPAILKFFAAVSRAFPEKVYEENGHYFIKLCTLITEETSTELLENALDSLTGIASSDDGKQVLNRLGPRFTNTVRRIGHLAKTGNSELRLLSLHCLASMMTVSVNASEETKLSCEAWFQEMDRNPLEFLLSVSKNPIMEPRLAVLRIYLGMADQSWGQKAMRDHATFCEYLLDRNTEKEKSGLDLKFSVILKLLSSPTAGVVFAAPYILKLKIYERQGPLFVQATSQVAMEEA